MLAAMSEASHPTPLPSLDPLARFSRWQRRARSSEPMEATVCVMATADAEGRPHARAVLLKRADERGFVVYTNLRSPKARQIEANPFAALCFYWPSRREQVRVEGPVERVSDEEADAYFATRPRGSQLGAWASHQSEPIASREALMQAVARCAQRFPEGEPVPRPPFWGGLRLRPDRMEFWREGPDRLHDRWLYVRDAAGGWTCTRIQP